MNKPTTRGEFLSATTTPVARRATLAASAVPALGQSPATPRIVSRHPTLAEVDALVVVGPAGIGAALSARKRIMPREINVRELQDALRVDGVNFDVTDQDQTGLRS